MTEIVELTIDRLLLRPFRLDDVDDVLTFASDTEMSRYVSHIPQPYTRRDAEEFVSKQVLLSWETQLRFAIVFDAQVVGGIGLSVNRTHAVAGLDYGIARDSWGKGLVPEAARAVFIWAFRVYGLAKIYAWADLRNTQLQRVMEKLGMTREGVLRSHSKGREGRIDRVYYGLLREEWEELNRE